MWLLLAFLLFLPTSCTVKEDRSLCPCWMQIDLSQCPYSLSSVTLLGWTQRGGSLFNCDVNNSLFTAPCQQTVPRGEIVSYCALAGLESEQISDLSLGIPVGEQCGQVYAYRADVLADGESIQDCVRLHKQFAAVAVKISDVKGPFSLLVRSRWCGWSLVDLSPLRGEFTYCPSSSEDDVWLFRIPRQGDDSIVLELTLQSGLTYTFPLGDEIRRSGYDWGAEDLDDISIGLDYVSSGITIEVVGWQQGVVYDEII